MPRPTIAALLVLSLATGCAPRASGQARSLGNLSAPASCNSYDAVDRSALAAFEADLEAKVVRAAAVARELDVSLAVPAGYEHRRVVATNLAQGWVSDGVTIAFGSLDGRWWIRGNEPGYRIVFDGPMPPEAVQALEAALAQACLFDEPVYMPSDVPLTNGQAAGCDDGVSSVIQIDVPGRRRGSYQQCRPWGYTEEVRAALVHAVLPPPD